MNLRTLEEEFEKHYRNFSDEVRTAHRFFHAFNAVHDMFDTDARVARTLDDTPYFWNSTLAAYQTCTLLGIARIFDDASTYNVYKLLVLARNPALYTLAALKDRKLRESTQANEYIDAYIEGSREPTPSELKFFKTAVRKHKDEFDAHHLNLRNRWLAHRDMTPAEAREAIAQMSLDGVQDMLTCLLNIERALFQLYYNGYPPLLEELESTKIRSDIIVEDVKELIERAAGIVPSA